MIRSAFFIALPRTWVRNLFQNFLVNLPGDPNVFLWLCEDARTKGETMFQPKTLTPNSSTVSSSREKKIKTISALGKRGAEPSLQDLLSDSTTKTLMAHDRVDEASLLSIASKARCAILSKKPSTNQASPFAITPDKRFEKATGSPTPSPSIISA